VINPCSADPDPARTTGRSTRQRRLPRPVRAREPAVSFGVVLVARAIPWAGLATGALLALAGLVALAGRRVALPLHLHIPIKRERGLGAMLLFGVGYGAASLGCTLPLFLTLIAASSGPNKLTVFAAYAAGTAVVLMALSVLVAVAREGVARAVRPILRT